MYALIEYENPGEAAEEPALACFEPASSPDGWWMVR